MWQVKKPEREKPEFGFGRGGKWVRGDWWQRRGAATVGLTGWGSAQIRETKREKLLVGRWDSTTRHDTDMRGNEERKRGIPKPREQSYIRTPGCQKKGTRQQKEEDQVPPHQPCTDYELPKVECRTPLSPALQSNCFRRCCWKVPYKGCKGVMKGKAPTIEREREGIPVPRDKTQDTTQQDTIQQDTIQKNKTIQPLQTIDKLDDALGLAKCSQEISFTPLSPCSNSWENKETK